MLKSISAALLAIAVLTAPAVAGPSYVKTDAAVATPASTRHATRLNLSPDVANAFARHGGRHHMRHHHMRRHHHHMGRHPMHRHHGVKMYRR